MKIIIKKTPNKEQSSTVTIDVKKCYSVYAIRKALELALDLEGYPKDTIKDVFSDTACCKSGCAI